MWHMEICSLHISLLSVLLHLLKWWFLIDHRLLRVQDFAGPNTTEHLSNLRHFHICLLTASGVASAMASSGDSTGSMFFNQLCTQKRLQLCFRGTAGNLNIIEIAYIKQIYILAILCFLPRRGGHKTIQREKKQPTKLKVLTKRPWSKKSECSPSREPGHNMKTAAISSSTNGKLLKHNVLFIV